MICPIFEAKKEATINNAIEAIDNPFESIFHVQSIPKRNSNQGKKVAAKRRQKKIKLDDDPETDVLLRILGRVNVIN